MFECASPDGQTIATLYRITDGPRQIDQQMKLNLRPSGSKLDSSMSSFAFRHGYDAIIRWRSDQLLEIEYPADSVITTQEMVVFGSSQTFSANEQIRVTYREKPSTHGYFMVEQRCFRGE